MKKPVQLPLVQALSWILGSVFIISVSAHLGLKSYFTKKQQRARSAQYAISTIVQTGPQKEALKTAYLAELLNLSANRSPSSLTFNLRAAESALMASPLISEAQVKLIQPNALYIDYKIRQPVAWLYDYQNIALDKLGYPIPFSPFFSPKNLPEIYFGLSEFGTPTEDPERPTANWGKPLDGKYVNLSFSLLRLLDDPQIRDVFQVGRIDVSNAFAESYGTREIVLIVEDTIACKKGDKEYHFIFPKILRLSTKNYAQELGNYLKLRQQLVDKESQEVQKTPLDQLVSPIRKKEKIIDFRIENLAFIDEQTAK